MIAVMPSEMHSAHLPVQDHWDQIEDVEGHEKFQILFQGLKCHSHAAAAPEVSITATCGLCSAVQLMCVHTCSLMRQGSISKQLGAG